MKTENIKEFENTILSGMELFYSNGMSLYDIRKMAYEMHGDVGVCIFLDFVKKHRNDEKFMNEFNKTSFIDDVRSELKKIKGIK